MHFKAILRWLILISPHMPLIGSGRSSPVSSMTHTYNVEKSAYLLCTPVMLVSDLAFLGAAMRLPVGGRVFYHIPIMLLTTASIAYFCMASDLGGVPIYVEFVRKGFGGGTVPTRSIWVCHSVNRPDSLLIVHAVCPLHRLDNNHTTSSPRASPRDWPTLV